jgi:tetratricopeptide (TPR) repeat protein
MSRLFRLVVAGPLIAVVWTAPAAAQCSPAVQKLLADRELETARAQMTAVISRTPKDHAALECLGRVYFAMTRYRDAAEQFEKAIKADENVASHHLWLGNALGNTADSTSKIKLPFLARRVKSEFERTVALDPQSINGRAGLVDFYAQAPSVMGGSMDKAHDQAREIIKLNPMRGHLEEADLYAREKKPSEVERSLKAAEQASPDSAVAAYSLGSFYQNNQRWADAFAVYDRMLKRFPGELLVHFQVGRTAALSGEQLDRGERELKFVLSTAPADFSKPTLAGAHHRLGMIYEKQGRKEAARAEYQAAVTINPKNEDAKKSLAALK